MLRRERETWTWIFKTQLTVIGSRFSVAEFLAGVWLIAMDEIGGGHAFLTFQLHFEHVKCAELWVFARADRKNLALFISQRSEDKCLPGFVFPFREISRPEIFLLFGG